MPFVRGRTLRMTTNVAVSARGLAAAARAKKQNVSTRVDHAFLPVTDWSASPSLSVIG